MEESLGAVLELQLLRRRQKCGIQHALHANALPNFARHRGRGVRRPAETNVDQCLHRVRLACNVNSGSAALDFKWTKLKTLSRRLLQDWHTHLMYPLDRVTRTTLQGCRRVPGVSGDDLKQAGTFSPYSTHWEVCRSVVSGLHSSREQSWLHVRTRSGASLGFSAMSIQAFMNAQLKQQIHDQQPARRLKQDVTSATFASSES